MILTVIGTRPQFIKAAMVSKELLREGITENTIHTGQHYDPEMSAVFFNELQMPEPIANLGCQTNSGTGQIECMVSGILPWVSRLKPAALMVYGDTNSAMAGALAAQRASVPLIHIEAGLRSNNLSMPEERNRIAIDRLSTYLFCSSAEGRSNLLQEDISKNVWVSGDVMRDAFEFMKTYTATTISIGEILPFPVQSFILATVHRAANTESSDRMNAIINALGRAGMPVIWPLHPRNTSIALSRLPENIFLVPPVGYVDMQAILHAAAIVCTDSGGLQKEAYWAKKPCVTLREETEWIETVDQGWNILAGANTEKILAAIRRRESLPAWKELYGEDASAIIAATLKRCLDQS